MRYRIFPPGAYYFWRTAAQGPLIRWLLSIGIVLLCIGAWYYGIHRPLHKLCVPVASSYTSESARVLAELAHAESDESLAHIVLGDCTTTTLALLHLFEDALLSVQSYNCQKPTTKNNLSVQHTTCICTGTLAQCATFFTALAHSSIIVTSLDVNIKQQNHALVIMTFTGDLLISDQ